ncbi:MAG: DNA topoisomerase I, partial [Xanthobacteraceae bacterium]|nr:DNA topoisomerase I [Xanthobacteraceae bacterium]
RRFGSDPGRSLGEHPNGGGPVVAKSGRYGPYVSHNGINATLPNDKTLEAITLEEAVALIDARAAKGGGSPRRSGGRKARTKSATNAAAAAPGESAERKPAAKRSARPARPKSATKPAAKSASAKTKTPTAKARTASQ